MTFSKSDFLHIKWGLIPFLFALCAGGMAIVVSENFVDMAHRDQSNATHQLNDARKQLATAEEDRENMRAYTLEYGHLLEHGIIGNDQRLDWIEGLEKIHKQDRVPGFMEFKYAIAPQKPYTPVPPLDSGNFNLNLSDMTLQFELLHEEQLTAFFDALHTDIKGWFIIDHCAMERIAATADADDFGIAHHLKAECTGGWLTLMNRNAK